MYTHILVPIDGSPTSNLALAEAAQLALLTGAQVRLLHVADPASTSTGTPGQALLAQAREQLTGVGVAADTQLLSEAGASVARLVVEHARDWGASVIVLGTQGRRGLERLLLGSDAEQIARHAPMAVLLVRPQARGAAAP